MIKTKNKSETVKYSEISEIKCDSCGDPIISAKKKEDEVVWHATLILTKATIGSIKDGGTSYIEQERTDLCQRCYKEHLVEARNRGGICPSFYENAAQEDECEECDEKH